MTLSEDKLKRIEAILHEQDKGHEHPVAEFMQSCPTCGQNNPAHKPANVFCANGSCGAPLGHVQFKEEAEKIPKCWKCGGQDARLVK